MSQVLHKLDTSAFYEGDKNMVEHARQHFLVRYLESVLRWLYFKEGWFVMDYPNKKSNKKNNVFLIYYVKKGLTRKIYSK
jgi:hypothetical protein